MPATRSMLFVSHANPEDNDFSQWLALRLAAEGYPVWCDLTRLLGGERFWSDIEDAIRFRSLKFLFVLSRSSNHKTGPVDELHLALSTQRADSLRDYVIPLWIDDLPPLEFNVRLHGINAIPFNNSWAGGLRILVEKLVDDGVPKDHRFSAGAVGDWWIDNIGALSRARDQEETLLTNFYSVLDSVLFVYRLPPGQEESTIAPPFPIVARQGLIGSFAPPEVAAAHNTHWELYYQSALEGPALPEPPTGWRYGDLRRVVTGLLNLHWLAYATAKELPTHTFSGGRPSTYFTMGDIGLARIAFSDPLDSNKTRQRQLIGYKTVKSPSKEEPARRYWHFALEPRADADLGIGFIMKPHVLFSDGGETIWTDGDRLYRVRRSQCKGWWNDKWRDLILAAVHQLSGGRAAMDLNCSGAALYVSTNPAPILSPVSYYEPEVHHDTGKDEDVTEDVHDEDFDDVNQDGEEDAW